ncbi:hypothetical protein LDDCCGHA_6076 [Methylobacterium oxalidis]|nr:hypothetical protein LDDCCGHA_6076 [Methylobacterium oxalidis]
MKVTKEAAKAMAKAWREPKTNDLPKDQPAKKKG